MNLKTKKPNTMDKSKVIKKTTIFLIAFVITKATLSNWDTLKDFLPSL